MNWVALNAVPLVNILGIILDIAGAFLVATEVISKFRGMQYGSVMTFGSVSPAPPLTDEYKKWARRRERKMTLGLVLLTVGFSLQAFANILQIKAVS